MTCITTLHPKQLSTAVLGPSPICATVNPAQSASPSGLEGSLTAYPPGRLFKGTSGPLAANSEACRPSQAVALEVRNGRFKLTWNERHRLDARIRAAGAFYETAGASPVQAEKHLTIVPTFQGRLAARDLTAN
jgi:hypothetical protein